MTVIQIDKVKKHIITQGHADFNSVGHDTVCAAVSAVMMTLRAILLSAHINHSFGIDNRPYAEIKIRNNTKVARQIFDGACEMLVAIGDKHPKNITINERELVTGIDAQ